VYWRINERPRTIRISDYLRFQIIPDNSPDDFRFQILDSRFQIPDFRFQISDSRFQIPDFRFQISSGICDLESAVWNLKSESGI
jgi:hypothetical protein